MVVFCYLETMQQNNANSAANTEICDFCVNKTQCKKLYNQSYHSGVTTLTILGLELLSGILIQLLNLTLWLMILLFQ